MHTPEQRPGDLLTLADHDLKVAELVAREGESFNIVAFLAQQATEKAVKAVLAYHDIDYPKTHDVQALLSLVKPSQPDADQFVDDAEDIQDYGVSVRYDIELFPSWEEADKALDLARRTLTWAREIVRADTGEA